jgi:DNA polymerase V
MYAHADANSFYASCEQVFAPALKGKPVIVLSNNDGCVIARSAQAKPFIPMGAPIHQWQEVVEKHQIQVFSANFSLYGDLSARVMSTLGRFTHRMEVYSVDEAFLDFSAVAPDALVDYALEVNHTVKQWIGIPVSIGVAGTKTLAKLANKAAKQGAAGVLALQTEAEIDAWLDRVAVEDVWGIGPVHSTFLHAHQIDTALQLKHAPERWIKQHLHLPGLRTVLELRGISCIPMEEAPAPKQQIAVTRSFGRNVDTLAELKEAVAFYCMRAGEKLREQHALVSVLTVFIATNPFQPDKPQYSRSCVVHLSAPTNDTGELIAAAFGGLQQLYREGFGYHRAGVFLQEFAPDSHRQLRLFAPNEGFAQQQAIGELVDRINKRFGHETIWYAAAGRSPGWKMRQEHRSPRYTTRIDELPLVT